MYSSLITFKPIMKKTTCLLIAFLSSMIIFASENTESKKILHAYKAKCDLVADKPIVLKMADTLYTMASKIQNHDYKITAKCLKVTFFVDRPRSRDSVSKYCTEVKNLCHGNEDDVFYFFAWAESISDHISRREFNLAMNEINDLRKLSETKQSTMGLATCYSQMTNLYSEKENYKLAAKYMKKSVALTEKYKLNEYNLSVYYTTLAIFLLRDNHTAEAYHYIKRAYKAARTGGHTMQVRVAEAEYWYQKKNEKQLERVLNEAQKQKTAFDDRALFAAEYFYNLLKGNYTTAASSLEKMYNIGALQKGDYLYRKARIYETMPGAHLMAIRCWKDYVTFKDSIYQNDSEIEISEFATMMDMAQLKQQNQQMQIEEKNSSLHKTMALLAISVLFIIILTYFLVKIAHLNNHLKLSQKKLVRRNNELTQAKKTITHEKEYIQVIHNMEEAFVKNIQYELASPVNSIIGFGQALHEVKDQPQEVINCADVIEQTGKNLHKMVSEMGILFSLHLDKSKITLSPISVNEVCRVATSQMQEISNGSISIVHHTWKEEFAIMSDSNSISAIIRHLIDNSLKYAPNSDITVDTSLAEDQESVRICVSDNGPGIPKEKREQVFEGFTKLDKFVPGAGLGLPISRITATRINATLEIDDTYTNGCKFVLSIPVIRYEG